MWESVASGVPRAGLVQVAVAESDAAFSNPRTATQLGLERIGTNPAQHTEGRGGAGGTGTVAIPGGGAWNLRARKNRLRPAGSVAREAEAEGAGWCGGSLFYQRGRPSVPDGAWL